MKYEFLIQRFLIQPRPKSNLNSFLKNTVHCAKNIFIHILEIKIKRRGGYLCTSTRVISQNIDNIHVSRLMKSTRPVLFYLINNLLTPHKEYMYVHCIYIRQDFLKFRFTVIAAPRHSNH